jgi:hypothetical protein
MLKAIQKQARQRPISALLQRGKLNTNELPSENAKHAKPFWVLSFTTLSYF